MTTINQKIDLKPFCAEEPGRYQMTEPWVRGGKKCATNGAIAIWIECDEPDSLIGWPFPPLESVVKHGSGLPLEWPNRIKNCIRCNGTGRNLCEECGGSGVCGHCGQGKCPRCDGKGYGEQCADCAVKVGEHLINAKYHKLILGLPNPKYFVSDETRRPLQFVFDGGMVAVMGMPNL